MVTPLRLPAGLMNVISFAIREEISVKKVRMPNIAQPKAAAKMAAQIGPVAVADRVSVDV